MSTVETKFNVGMTCDGCANAIKRILGKIEGVQDIQTNVENKTVIVRGSADKDVMLAALKKWGAPANKLVELA
jgi:copper chaperone